MDPLYHVMSTIVKLKEAYVEVSRMDTSEPVMSNTERVYAGMTYNRNMMSENLSRAEGNRGILA